MVPPRLGYRLATRVASAMAKREATMFTTVRENLRHVLPHAGAEELSRLAEEAIAHAGRTYYDMFRFSDEDYRRGRVPLRVDVEEWRAVREVLADDRGTVLVGPHMSNFDMAARWIVAQGFTMQGLSLPQPNTGTRVLNRLRRRSGIEMTPLDVSALRMAVKRLRQGGIVLTGVDRPVSLMEEPVLFFDAPARLPTGHVRLALQTCSRIVVGCCLLESAVDMSSQGFARTLGKKAALCRPDELDCCYRIQYAPPLEMEEVGGREESVRHNVMRVLEIIERMIRQAPSQWLMFVPVWDT
ncbi:MAG: hypothetical protein H5T69_05565 [Chloroflexi bacterium]|nr:hypothetical protein [Chloroflexota bacterium]